MISRSFVPSTSRPSQDQGVGPLHAVAELRVRLGPLFTAVLGGFLFAMSFLGAAVQAADEASRSAPEREWGVPDAQADLRAIGEQHVSFTLSEGSVTVEVLGVQPEEIQDLVWAGRSVWESVLHEAVLLDSPSRTAFTLPLDFRADPAGVLEIWLNSGDVLVRGIPDDSVLEQRQLSGDLTQAACAYTPLYSVSRCGGTTTSYSVPYRCCDNNYDGDAKDSGDGNCVWLAWVKAREWGWKVPSPSMWGNASNWCDKAAATSGWSVSSTPTKNSIACSKSIGHVAWVTSVDSVARTFTVTEQNCKVEPSCFGSGTRTKTRSFSSAWKFIRCTNTKKCGA